MATRLVVLFVALLLVGVTLQKNLGSVVSNQIEMKFGTPVLQVTK